MFQTNFPLVFVMGNIPVTLKNVIISIYCGLGKNHYVTIMNWVHVMVFNLLYTPSTIG